MIGDMIQELRKDRNLDQKDLAKLLNVTTGTISNYETGTHSPSYESVIKLADYFDVSVDYLLGHTKLSCSLTKFNKTINGGRTIGDLMNDILSLKDVDFVKLVDYVSLLQNRK